MYIAVVDTPAARHVSAVVNYCAHVKLQRKQKLSWEEYLSFVVDKEEDKDGRTAGTSFQIIVSSLHHYCCLLVIQ